ncbi:hypothetical protein [Marinifilum caeruleilacunae]|uniref:DUF4468 domain-containing protein n=1 Tax=Marinifilum caeruleilacunae TaxID=2499076 RepID=A0ABX1WX24_9BACT|nr:hypothetical protein [Marinifilum caeruleilacunae]NOU60637.1 hypothetical protein [Marinifilum caeruleilacunae]
MKTITFLLLLISTSLIGQEYQPKLIVLDPYEKVIDEKFEKEIRKYEMKLITTPEYDENILSSIKQKAKQENEVVMEYKDYLFAKEMNYFSRVSIGFSGFITYKLYNYNSNCLVFSVHESSNESIENYKNITKKHKVDWLINPILVRTYIDEGQTYTDIRIQLYNRKKNKIQLDCTYTGNSKNPGFEWACEDGSINCTVNNAQAQAINEIMKFLINK